MPATVTAVNPLLLVWARERSGRSLAEVAALLKKQPADISAWEAGEKAPTYAQLEALAYQVYKRPIALFFFPEPPDEPLMNTARVSSQGRVTLPIEVRRALGLEPGDELQFEETSESSAESWVGRRGRDLGRALRKGDSVESA